MYNIIGTDDKQYGPVSADKLRQWLREGRLNRRTRVRLDSGAEWKPLEFLPEIADELRQQAGPSVAPPVVAADSGLNAVIPYRNVRALVAYYCAIFSLIPVMGLVLGFAGLILGILGLRFRRENPTSGGAVHAWIGIILGGLCGLANLALLILMFVAIASNHH